MKPKALTTNRLALHPLSTEHTAELFSAFSDPETMRFMPSHPHKTVDETRAEIERMNGYDAACYWSICLPSENSDESSDDKAIGFVGYLGNSGVPGMGYFLHRDYWRQGITSEAVRAALDYGFDELGLDRVELWINHDNFASQGLAEKIGFVRRGQFRMKYEREAMGHDKLVYGIYKWDWQNCSAQLPVEPRQIYRIEPILAVANLQETLDFYHNKLNFDVDFVYGDPPEYAGISCCEWTTEGGHLQLSQEEIVDGASSGVALYFFVGPDIDMRYKHYKEQGVTIHRELETMPWGLTEFAIRDCNGYLLRFGTSG